MKAAAILFVTNELVLVPNNSTQRTTTPALSGTDGAQSHGLNELSGHLWTCMDILQTFHRGGPQTRGMVSVYYIKEWRGG